MPVKVIDTSALAAVLFGEPAADEVAARLQSATLAAPALIDYELGNACWKKCRRHPKLASALREAFLAYRDLDLKLHDVDPAAVLTLAEREALTFYDASYLWLASVLQAELVTLDTRLQVSASRVH